MDEIKLPLRNQLPENMTWDLSVLYSSFADWEKDFARLDDLLTGFNQFQGRLGESAATLKAAIEKSDELERLSEKVYVFAHLRADEDLANNQNKSYLERASAKFAEIGGETAWFDPEFMALSQKTIDEYLKAPELAFYRRSIEELLRERAHTLSSKEERILAMFSDVLGSAGSTYSTLCNADMRFPTIDDEQGRKIELSHGNYRNFLESPKREVRRTAFEAMFETHKALRNTIASTLDATVKYHVLDADLRHYDSALAASLFEDNVPESVYHALIEAVHESLPALHRYMELRAEVMKLDSLDMYDIYNPLQAECSLKFTYHEACELVRAALGVMGEEYQNALDRAFAERWIDVLECKGKRSGAYSSGCFDSNPYLLLNFNGTLNDVFTLAHELGHSMHSYFSNKYQKYHYANYSIFVAEVASTTAELLLHNYLMKKYQGNHEVVVYLLTHLLDEIRGTIFRQTQFAEFELKIHEISADDIPLTAEVLDKEYAALNQLYYGPAVKADALIACEWERIPHFYYDFYVYKYATGMSAALQLSNNILSGDAVKLTNYLNFLKAGDSMDVLDIMKMAGVDLSHPTAVKSALGLFDEIVTQLQNKLQ